MSIRIDGKFNSATVFTDSIEPEAYKQILNLMNQKFAEGSKFAIMPDVHAGPPKMTYDDLIVCTYEDQLFNVAFDYYEVEPVNKLIEELKERLHEAETRADLAEAANTKYRIDIQNLKKCIEELE